MEKISSHSKSMMALALLIILTAVIITTFLNMLKIKTNLVMKLKWQQPNISVNGEALSNDEISSYRINWSLDNSHVNSVVVDGLVREYQIKELEPGEYNVSIQAETIYGTYSTASKHYKVLAAINN